MQRVFERKVDIYTESVRFGRWGFLRDVGTAAVRLLVPKNVMSMKLLWYCSILFSPVPKTAVRVARRQSSCGPTDSAA